MRIRADPGPKRCPMPPSYPPPQTSTTSCTVQVCSFSLHQFIIFFSSSNQSITVFFQSLLFISLPRNQLIYSPVFNCLFSFPVFTFSLILLSFSACFFHYTQFPSIFHCQFLSFLLIPYSLFLFSLILLYFSLFLCQFHSFFSLCLYSYSLSLCFSLILLYSSLFLFLFPSFFFSLSLPVSLILLLSFFS